MDDPIIMPGKFNQFWHHHTFFGAVGLNGFTRNPRDDHPRSSCAGGSTINRTGYWVPSMIDTRYRRPMMPNGMSVYYKGSPDTEIPQGFRFITGTPANAAPKDPSAVPVSVFTCFTGGTPTTQGLGDEIPPCPGGDYLLWVVSFPNCINGALDSTDHKSHAAFASVGDGPFESNGCPSTHPYRIFDISYNIRFDLVDGDDTTYWRLASDMYDWDLPAGYSGHGDWWNGWAPGQLQDIMDTCFLPTPRDCGQDNMGNGTYLHQ
jgi:hypothetical protein